MEGYPHQAQQAGIRLPTRENPFIAEYLYYAAQVVSSVTQPAPSIGRFKRGTFLSKFPNFWNPNNTALQFSTPPTNFQILEIWKFGT